MEEGLTRKLFVDFQHDFAVVPRGEVDLLSDRVVKAGRGDDDCVLNAEGSTHTSCHLSPTVRVALQYIR